MLSKPREQRCGNSDVPRAPPRVTRRIAAAARRPRPGNGVHKMCENAAIMPHGTRRHFHLY